MLVQNFETLDAVEEDGTVVGLIGNRASSEVKFRESLDSRELFEVVQRFNLVLNEKDLGESGYRCQFTNDVVFESK